MLGLSYRSASQTRMTVRSDVLAGNLTIQTFTRTNGAVLASNIRN
jgi:hypothetical protein